MATLLNPFSFILGKPRQNLEKVKEPKQVAPHFFSQTFELKFSFSNSNNL